MHFEKYTEVPYELAEKLTEEARLKKEAGR
jgi:hypothetical protein